LICHETHTPCREANSKTNISKKKREKIILEFLLLDQKKLFYEKCEILHLLRLPLKLQLVKINVFLWCYRVPAARIKLYALEQYGGPHDIALIKTKTPVIFEPGLVMPVSLLFNLFIFLIKTKTLVIFEPGLVMPVSC